MHDPGVVAVDLSSVLPGGDNGGAKVVVLELMRRLAARAPRTRFFLLTRAESHGELALLDAPNVERRLVAGGDVPAAEPGLRFAPWRVAQHLPGCVRSAAGSLAYRVLRHRRRAGARAVLREIGADLFFCPFTAPTYAAAGVPVVSVVHDLQYLTYPQFFAAADVFHREQTFRAACREATLMVAISDYARESALRHGTIEPHRIRTIHHRLGDRLGAAARRDEGAVGRFGLSRGRYLIYPANFWKHKNHEMLLTSFGIAARRGLPEDFRLVCTGAPGARRDYLAHAAAAMGLGERVVFPGYVATQELAALLGSSAGLVFPSLYEGFGLPVLEAMTAGVPVACSNATSLPEIASGAAILFDPRRAEPIAGAMIALAADPRRCAGLVSAGRSRAAEFSDGERMAAEYWEAFREAKALAVRPSRHGKQDG